MLFKIGSKIVAIINAGLERIHLGIICRPYKFMDRKPFFKLGKTYDVVRGTTLDLLIGEIKRNNIPGAAAELGVYKGLFAKYINEGLKDRKLYLFDTFEGFSNGELDNDLHSNLTKEAKTFGDTSVQKVLDILDYPNQVIIKKGFFPDTAENLDETFCFVSLDVDLYQPTKAGLEYFYPRLNSGGYILIHDFNNRLYKGTQKAVNEFCEENKIVVVPGADVSGSCIIVKK